MRLSLLYGCCALVSAVVVNNVVQDVQDNFGFWALCNTTTRST
jgi:hypothetical protein